MARKNNYRKPSIEVEGFAVTDYDGGAVKEAQCRVRIGDLELWFSYKTLVAYKFSGEHIRVCDNVWSATTGKHIAKIDGGASKLRVKFEQFALEAEAILAHIGDGFQFENFRSGYLAEKRRQAQDEAIEAGQRHNAGDHSMCAPVKCEAAAEEIREMEQTKQKMRPR